VLAFVHAFSIAPDIDSTPTHYLPRCTPATPPLRLEKALVDVRPRASRTDGVLFEHLERLVAGRAGSFVDAVLRRSRKLMVKMFLFTGSGGASLRSIPSSPAAS